VINEYLLKVYFFLMPRHPHSLHLYRLAKREDLIAASIKFLVLLLLIDPSLPQEGHLDVSGKVLKNIFNCNS
jgi:hypothetical protein